MRYAEALVEALWFEERMALGVYRVILFRIGDVELVRRDSKGAGVWFLVQILY